MTMWIRKFNDQSIRILFKNDFSFFIKDFNPTA